MSEQQGFIWIETSGDCNDPSRNDPALENGGFWGFLADTDVIALLVKIIVLVLLPLIITGVFRLIAYFFPSLAWTVSYYNAVFDASFGFVAICCIVLLFFFLNKHDRKHNEHRRWTWLFRAHFHHIFHHIRNCFCKTDSNIENRFLKIQEKIENFQNTKHSSKTKFGKAKDLLLSEIKQLNHEVVDEVCTFFSNSCNEIAVFFEFLSPNEKLDCCIRVAQEEPSIDGKPPVLGYATLGRSRGVSQAARVENSVSLHANRGVPKIISNGVRQSSKNCVLLIQSIERSIALGEWEKSANDSDPSIRSVMIAPINFRRPFSTNQNNSARMDGLLYVTSPKEGSKSPFSESYAKRKADIAAGIADFMGCLVYRLNERQMRIKQLRDFAESLSFS